MPAELVTKRMRQDMILEIVKSSDVHNQMELIRRLEERGITATQSSVSRDIHELSIAKVDGRYVVAVLPVHGAHDASESESEDSEGFVKDLQPAGPSVLVVKTTCGSAPSVRLSIDKARWPEVLGSVADDDTIFIATLGKREQVRLITRLQQFMDQPQTIDVHGEEAGSEMNQHSPHARPFSPTTPAGV